MYAKDRLDTLACCVRAVLESIVEMYPDIRVVRKQVRMCAFDREHFDSLAVCNPRLARQRRHMEDVGCMPDIHAFEWTDFGLSLRELLDCVAEDECELIDTDDYGVVWPERAGAASNICTFSDLAEDAGSGITLPTADWFLDCEVPLDADICTARQRLVCFLRLEEYTPAIVHQVFVQGIRD